MVAWLAGVENLSSEPTYSGFAGRVRGTNAMKINGWIITCTGETCDTGVAENNYPNFLFYTDLDWACTDAGERNKDHKGHKVMAVQITRRFEKAKPTEGEK